MNGVHDLGGMDGFGPVEREADESLLATEVDAHLGTREVVGTGDATPIPAPD